MLPSQYIPSIKVPVPSSEPETFQITPEEERLIAQLWPIVERSEHEILSGFSEEEKA